MLSASGCFLLYSGSSTPPPPAACRSPNGASCPVVSHRWSNSLSPGGVENGQSDEFIKKVTSLIPMGRMANKDEYCSAIQFLCSDASLYLNGQNIVMDGGRSVW